MLRLFWKLNAPRQNTVFILKNARDLLGYTEKKVLLKSLATLFAFICKMPNFYRLCVTAFIIRNNEQFKASKKWRKFKNNKIQRNCTDSYYKKECVFIPF